MIVTAQVRPEKRSVIPSVTHADGSARPQKVEKEINALYWQLIDESGKRTRGEALGHTPTDALVIGSFLVEK
jgi:predicted NodU family carbamoyl transferase